MITVIVISVVPITFAPPLQLLPVILMFALFLWCIGAFTLRKTHFFILCLTSMSIVWVLLFAKYYARPSTEVVRFVSHIPSILLFLIGALVATEGIRLTEWVFLFRRIPLCGVFLANLLLGVSAGVETPALQKNLEARRVAAPRLWLAQEGNDNTVVYILTKVKDSLFDRVELLVAITVGLAEEVSDAVLKPIAFADASPTCNVGVTSCRIHKLCSIYKLPGFSQLYNEVFGDRPISAEWFDLLKKHLRHDSIVVDVGAGSGRVSDCIHELCRHTDALERDSDMVKRFRRRLLTDRPSTLSLIVGEFPVALEGRTYDLAIFHQNVLVEVINDSDLLGTWAAVAAITKPGGKVLFDYPLNNRELPPPNVYVQLAEMMIPTVGAIKYGYVYRGMIGQTHSFTVKLETLSEMSRVATYFIQLDLFLPSIDELLEVASSVGFRLVSNSVSSGHTFFPSQLGVYVLEKRT